MRNLRTCGDVARVAQVRRTDARGAVVVWPSLYSYFGGRIAAQFTPTCSSAVASDCWLIAGCSSPVGLGKQPQRYAMQARRSGRSPNPGLGLESMTANSTQTQTDHPNGERKEGGCASKSRNLCRESSTVREEAMRKECERESAPPFFFFFFLHD